jgi:hypothetical protein
MVGQVLYLEAEEAGVRATGIGCYFDDPVRDAFGITSPEWQSFYHFTVGGPVEDGRLTTLPAYDLGGLPHSVGTLKIHETIGESGALSAVLLQVSNGVLALVSDDATFGLPEGGLEAVMGRFGGPLDAASKVAVVATLDLGEGRALRHVRHLAVYDVIARDYVVYDAPGKEPLCALATTVAGALDHLGRAAAR